MGIRFGHGFVDNRTYRLASFGPCGMEQNGIKGATDAITLNSTNFRFFHSIVY
jgi:hypothetical protein